MTKASLEERCRSLNRRMEAYGSKYRYQLEHRYGYTAIDRFNVQTGALVSTARTGLTKGEAGEFLYAMMVALDDASYKTEED